MACKKVTVKLVNDKDKCFNNIDYWSQCYKNFFLSMTLHIKKLVRFIWQSFSAKSPIFEYDKQSTFKTGTIKHSTGLGPYHTRKYNTWLERLATNEHSSL
jgi:hypothetical protein